MTDDLISRQAAIKAFYIQSDDDGWWVGTAQDAETLLNGLPTINPVKWIPVSERLPEDNEYVLVTTAEGGVTDAKYWHRERIWVKGLAIMRVTAWMPLPKPWRGEEDERLNKQERCD